MAYVGELAERDPLERPPASARTGIQQVSVPQAMIDETLDCYLEHCRYLRSATLEYRRDGAAFATEYGEVSFLSRGRFSSVPPWYIRDTGHFNSIEFNLCYNQLSYVSLAHATTLGEIPWLWRHTDAGDIQSKKLSDALITRFSSRFHHAMQSAEFVGDFWVARAVVRGGRLFIKTGMAVTAPDGQRCSSGEVNTVILPRAQSEK